MGDLPIYGYFEEFSQGISDKQCFDCDTEPCIETQTEQIWFAMTLPTEMTHRDILRVRLAACEQDHRDLDHAIAALHETVNPDVLLLKRLKRQKLKLKDKIAKIQDELTPDIIA